MADVNLRRSRRLCGLQISHSAGDRVVAVVVASARWASRIRRKPRHGRWLPPISYLPGAIAVTDSQSNRLRVYQHSFQAADSPIGEPLAPIEVACETFREATGWPLRVITAETRPDTLASPVWSAPLVGGEGNDRRLVIGRPSATESTRFGSASASAEAAFALAATICGLYNELARGRRTLVAREAELAAGVPLVVREGDNGVDLAERLTAVLQGGAEGVGCHAAGLYMLDAATTELKLRSCWGLPSERLLDPPRPLEGELADLEALTGSAVVLDTRALMAIWRAPEAADFAAAVCVPVASSMTILGTLWMFCRDEREFNDRETNLIEIVAGRLAVELEREMLLNETAQSRGVARQLDATRRSGHAALPPEPPDLASLDVAATAGSHGAADGGFYDWSRLPDGRMAFTLGHAHANGGDPAAVGQNLRSALRAHGEHLAEPAKLLRYASQTMWQASAGDHWASAGLAAFDETTGRFDFVGAGEVFSMIVGPQGWRRLTTGPPLVGVSPDCDWPEEKAELAAGESLIVFSLSRLDTSQLDLVSEHLATSIRARACADAQQLLETTTHVLDGWQDGEAPLGARSVLVVLRKEG